MQSSAELPAQKTTGENVLEVCSFLTFCENQSGGRPGSEKGLMALLTDTLENREKFREKCIQVRNKFRCVKVKSRVL